jgi:hypothetical protein
MVKIKVLCLELTEELHYWIESEPNKPEKLHLQTRQSGYMGRNEPGPSLLLLKPIQLVQVMWSPA